MNGPLGIIGDLLETIGRLNGHSLHWVDGTGAFVPPGLCRADVGRLNAEIERTGTASIMEGGDKSWIGGMPAPSETGGRGLLVVQANGGNHDGPQRRTDWLHLLATISQLVEERNAMVGENQKLTEELSRAYEDIHLFTRITSQIRSLRFSRLMVCDLLGEIREAMRVELAAAFFDEPAEDSIQIVTADIGSVIPDAARFLKELGAAMPRSAPAFEEHCFIVNRSTDLPPFDAMHPAPFRALGVRIRTGEREYGWLMLVSFNMKEIFRRGEYRLLSTMAEQIALLMANSALYSDLERFVINLVKSLVTAIEAKDVYTKGHSERVTAYCLRMAAELGLDDKQRTDLQWASVLHDVGKIGTPESILNKPSCLTGPEYDRVKSHPAKGVEILRPITQLADALPAIRHHHERYNGGGYPDGLSGEAIPFLARIISVADTYDAVTSSRAYRAARPHDEAVRILREGAGSQFDPQVVAAFLRILAGSTDVRAAPEAGRPGAEAASCAETEGCRR